jgi:hypothetical protein
MSLDKLVEALLPASAGESILTQDPHGRLDIAALRTCEHVAKRGFGPGGDAVWNSGLGRLVEAVIVESVTAERYTVQDLGQAVGILKLNSRKRKGKGPREKERGERE